MKFLDSNGLRQVLKEVKSKSGGISDEEFENRVRNTTFERGYFSGPDSEKESIQRIIIDFERRIEQLEQRTGGGNGGNPYPGGTPGGGAY